MHFIINNQIGFTTNPAFSRSSPYPSDVAKMIEAPIFHVNGDDPEAVVYAAKVATEYRMKFHKPVVVDMFCYRRFGHNEGDEPSFTQPKMYKEIRAHKTVVQLYGERLIAEGLISEGELEKMKADWRAHLEQEFEAGQSYKPNKADWLDGAWSGLRTADNADEQRRGKTAVPMKQLKEIGRKLSTIPEGFKAHRTIQRFMDNRAQMIETGEGIDWAMGEALAFGSLAVEGHKIRLSGQDCERGTVLAASFGPLRSATAKNAISRSPISPRTRRVTKSSTRCCPKRPFSASNTATRSPSPNALTLWEAQFGDFANGAQVVFDQFISSR
ncbi:MAG: thiamine pyrophosphate-dependent enzyme [Agrobacterium tumefaciens]